MPVKLAKRMATHLLLPDAYAYEGPASDPCEAVATQDSSILNPPRAPHGQVDWNVNPSDFGAPCLQAARPGMQHTQARV